MKLQKKLIYLFAAALVFTSVGCDERPDRVAMVFDGETCPVDSDDEKFPTCITSDRKYAWIHGGIADSATKGITWCDAKIWDPCQNQHDPIISRRIPDDPQDLDEKYLTDGTRNDKDHLMWRVVPIVPQPNVDYPDGFDGSPRYYYTYGSGIPADLKGTTVDAPPAQRVDVYHFEEKVLSNLKWTEHDTWAEFEDEDGIKIAIYYNAGVIAYEYRADSVSKTPNSLSNLDRKLSLKALYHINDTPDQCPENTDTEEFVCKYSYNLDYMPVHGSTMTFETTEGAKAYYKEAPANPITGEAQYIWSLVYGGDHYVTAVPGYLGKYKFTIYESNIVIGISRLDIIDHNTWIEVRLPEDTAGNFSKLIIKRPQP